MAFHRFEDYEAVILTPHLSSGKSPVIRGKYLYYCLNQKEAGTGSELHYHPNELLIYMVRGKANGIVGKDRRIVQPGTFVLVPPNVRHSFKATEDGPCAYLYIKDKTWTVVGLAADERRPDRAMDVDEANAKFGAGQIVDRKGSTISKEGSEENSDIIIDGVPPCFYEMLSSPDQPYSSGRRIEWIEGERSAFGFFELPWGYEHASEAADHEYFYYVLDGALEAEVAGERSTVTAGGIVEIPKGAAYALRTAPDTPTRMVAVHSSDHLESRIDA